MKRSFIWFKPFRYQSTTIIFAINQKRKEIRTTSPKIDLLLTTIFLKCYAQIKYVESIDYQLTLCSSVNYALLYVDNKNFPLVRHSSTKYERYPLELHKTVKKFVGIENYTTVSYTNSLQKSNLYLILAVIYFKRMFFKPYSIDYI